MGTADEWLVILIAPNVSEQMGGEPMKALKIFQNLRALHPNTVQITHERCESELLKMGLSDVYYVRDDLVSLLLWKSRILRLFVDVWFGRKSIRLAEEFASENGWNPRLVIVHQTEPNSPVAVRSLSKTHRNVFGPINGNIYYPKCFRSSESLLTKFRRIFHLPLQRISKVFFPGLRKADLILAAGGERTLLSLRVAGVSSNRIVETIDCGVPEQLFECSLIQPGDTEFKNDTIVHFGRLVFHKGTLLAIEALAKCEGKVKLDIIGRGPMLDECKRLVETLELKDSVTFIDWFPSHNELLSHIRSYAGFVLPSLEDANGIVVQEAMSLGVPGICLDWGGPKLLIDDGEDGFLVPPHSKQQIVHDLADRMKKMVCNEGWQRVAREKARSKAIAWKWGLFAAEILSNQYKLLKLIKLPDGIYDRVMDRATAVGFPAKVLQTKPSHTDKVAGKDRASNHEQFKESPI